MTVDIKAQTDLWTVASNSARMVAINQMSESQAETYALSLLTAGEQVTVNIASSGSNVTSTVVRGIDDISMFGWMTWAMPALVVSTTQRIESSV